LTRSEAIDQIRNAVLALPANYREVVVLCDLHEIGYAEKQIPKCGMAFSMYALEHLDDVLPLES
jgi:hypothetical protein